VGRPFEIRLGEDSQRALDHMRAFDRAIVVDAIEENLRHEPLKETRNRKPLSRTPGLEDLGAYWELRIGAWRVLYQVEGDVLVVKIVRKGRNALGDVL
jgi:mRNA-degrading endonuclease RelE of RelBE toxin-antitoxin system